MDRKELDQVRRRRTFEPLGQERLRRRSVLAGRYVPIELGDDNCQKSKDADGDRRGHPPVCACIKVG